MIISMRLHATKEEIDNARARIEEFGYKVHSIAGEERVVIGAVGARRRHGLPGIARSHAGRRERRAHFRALQVRQPRIPPEKTADQGATAWRSAAMSSS